MRPPDDNLITQDSLRAKAGRAPALALPRLQDAYIVDTRVREKKNRCVRFQKKSKFIETKLITSS